MRLAVFVGFTFACVFNSMCEIEEAVVATNYGELRGRRLEILGAKVDAFLGIPYADPPVGNTRFSPANPWSTEWSGVRNASSFGAACWQKKYPPPIDHPGHIWWTTTDECSEDCLFLNVWTPYPAPSDAPVVVFIHGGSLIAGTTSASLYNGATLAAVENVVVVSMNYRLGLLGFLSFFTENEPGNLGLLDQAMALLWVKDNIEHFGGNADSVTLIGHSAGAASVGLHLMSPASRPFFRRAILQSGAPNTGWTMTSRAQDLWVAGKLAKNVHCPTWLDSSNLSYESVVIDTLRCLRERGPQNLVNSDPLDASKTVGGYVVVDGFFLPDNPQLILADSDMKQTSIIIGTVDEESLLNMGHLPKFRFDIPKVEAVRNTYSADDYKQSIDLLFPYVDQSVRDVIWFEYRDWFDPNNGTKLHRSVIDMWEDFCMVCPIKEFANFYAEAGNNVYAYNYDHRSSKSPWKEWLGTVHADELLFTLGLAMHDDEGLEDMEKQLSRKILKYWGNYARTGSVIKDSSRSVADGYNVPVSTGKGNDAFYADYDPNNPSSPVWPKYTKKEPKIMNLNIELVENNANISEFGRVKECALWSDLIPKLSHNVDVIDGFHPIFLPTVDMVPAEGSASAMTCATSLVMTSPNTIVCMLLVHVSLYMI